MDDLNPPTSDVIANGWANFAETVLPTIGGAKNAQAQIAFYFGAMYVLQIVEQVVTERSVEGAALALGMLNAELDEFMKAHAIITQ